MVTRRFIFRGNEGFHIRPASQFVKLVKQATSEVTILFDGEEFDGKSPLSIMSACIEDGAAFSLIVDGGDEEAVITSIENEMVNGADRYFAPIPIESDDSGHSNVSAVVEQGLEQNAETDSEQNAKQDTGRSVEQETGRSVEQSLEQNASAAPDLYLRAQKGVAASEGIAIGPAYIYSGVKPVAECAKVSDAPAELERIAKAVTSLRTQLEFLRETSQGEGADIADAHISLLSDDLFLDRISRVASEHKCSAEFAVLEVLSGFETDYAKLKNERIRQRLSDITDICYGLHSELTGIKRDVTGIPPGSIIAAADLLPSDTLRIIPHKVTGFILEGGSTNSHTAIVAKSLELPAIVGAAGILSLVSTGSTIAMDGTEGQYWIDPDRAVTEALQSQIEAEAKEREALQAYINIATGTADGVHAEILANIVSPDDMAPAIERGAEGVGLFRTEFIYMNRDMPPSEEEQFTLFERALASARGRPVTIRTLDMGGDKPITCLPSKAEDNPFLGKRGIRYSLDGEPVFREQIRALLRASAFGDLHIMLPMITVVEEVERALEIIGEESAALRGQGRPIRGYKVGIMIETPAAALLSRHLASMVDFFSIGSNDLIQYTMAADRGNTEVASLGSPYSPAVLSLIKMTADAAIDAGIGISICGESASDPLLAPLYLSFGIMTLSVVPGRIAALRRYINSLDLSKWTQAYRQIPDLKRAGDVRDALQGLYKTST